MSYIISFLIVILIILFCLGHGMIPRLSLNKVIMIWNLLFTEEWFVVMQRNESPTTLDVSGHDIMHWGRSPEITYGMAEAMKKHADNRYIELSQTENSK